MQDGGLLNQNHRKEQREKINQDIKPIEEDDVIHSVFNVIIQLRVNADILEAALKKLKEEDD